MLGEERGRKLYWRASKWEKIVLAVLMGWDFYRNQCEGRNKGVFKVQNAKAAQEVGFVPPHGLGLSFTGREDFKYQVIGGSCGRIVALPIAKVEV